MIDLHLHTTASDGALEPEEVVERAAAAGVRVIGIADHDTMAGVTRAASAAARLGMMCVPGIEVTSVCEGRDVHVLGYWLDAGAATLQALVARTRRSRVDRAARIVALLGRAGAPIDFESRLAEAERSGRSIARPEIARTIVANGHAATVAEAFDRFLSEGRPAYVPHVGPTPFDAVAAIRAAGGVSSLAHPGTLRRDDLIPALSAAGLDALEVFHSEHAPEDVARYMACARDLGLATSGGSDFHVDGDRRGRQIGRVHVPPESFAGLLLKLKEVAVRGVSSPRKVSEDGHLTHFGSPQGVSGR